jgi:hypothetical protein
MCLENLEVFTWTIKPEHTSSHKLNLPQISRENNLLCGTQGRHKKCIQYFG